MIAIEVIQQVERTGRLLHTGEIHLARKIEKRDDYIDHLKSVIDNGCFDFLRRSTVGKAVADRLRAMSVVTANLERIADHAVSIVDQTGHFDDWSLTERYGFEPFLARVLDGLRLVVDAFLEADPARAVRICQAEVDLDDLYMARFKSLLAEMMCGRQVPDLVTVLFISHYLERMGDCLLNIGEAILFFKMGERLKFRDYQSLRDAVAELSDDGAALADVDLEGIWGTKSGCRIGKLSGSEQLPDGDSEVIYKQGDRAKISQERDRILQWEELAPGLPPRVVDYREDAEGDTATLLIEYLDGVTFQDVIVNPELGLLEESCSAVQATLQRLWNRTREPKSIRPAFMAQLGERLDDVFKIHPEFDSGAKRIGPVSIPPLVQLVERLADLDEALAAPFAVFGHGDFNLDNIIYNPEQKQVHFIDLHRSGRKDYAAEMSVFLVSNFRLPVFGTALRDRLQQVIQSFLAFVRGFGREQGDDQIEVRLALGLARSFATSTRFELDQTFARKLFQRSRYLLERVAEHRPRPWSKFHLPEQVLHD